MKAETRSDDDVLSEKNASEDIDDEEIAETENGKEAIPW